MIQMSRISRPAPRESIPRHSYSVQEAADSMGISKDATYRLVHSGQLETVELGGRIVITPQAIEKMLTERVRRPAATAAE
jgi:excisionase family DNA binding protein